jgi:ABC-type nitrate/sulfonate/bicarbonate transport system substrate-binding protein
VPLIRYGTRLSILLFIVLISMGPKAPDIVRVDQGGPITFDVARKNGLFAKYGLQVEVSHPINSEVMRTDLASGKVDIVDDGLDNALALIASSDPDVVIVASSSTADQELIAQPEIKSIAELRGKTLIVDAPDTQNAVMMKKILLMQGLRPGVDYKMLSVSTQRLPEMRTHKEYAAGMLSGAAAMQARKEGFVRLASSSESIGPLLFSGLYVRRQWATPHSDMLKRYIAANIEAQRWILAPESKAGVIALIKSGNANSALSDDIVSGVYQGIVSGPGALLKDLHFDVTDFQNLVRLRAEIEGSWGGQPPSVEKFYDLSYYQAALSMVESEAH